MPAGRVTENHNAVQVEVVFRRKRAEVVDGAADVEVRFRPPAPRLKKPTVLDVPRRDPAVL